MRSSAPRLILAALAVVGILAAPPPAPGAGWPTEGHDNQRTGQSEAVGPDSPDLTASVALPNEQSINMPPAVAADGTVFTGTWGLTRSYGLEDKTRWNKLDGKLFVFSPDLTAAWPEPFAGDLVPYCYTYPGRPGTPGFCPGGLTVNGYNGTVEGTPALSPDGSVLYVGRGDGKLYALDAETGEGQWVFTTFNPEDLADPEGGGEVIAAPLVAPDGTVYIASLGAGAYESNAVYALSPHGDLLWRFPHAEKSWQNIFVASPALSPDGSTLYVAGAWGPVVDDRDVEVEGTILAFDLTAPGGTGDDRLKWVHYPINRGEFWEPTVWTTALAVGSDGTLYASGPEYTLGGGSAVLFALRDLGDDAELAWERMVDLDRNNANFTLGLALREEEGVTTRIYASSGNTFNALSRSYPPGGKLYAIDPATGAELWTEPFDPAEHGGTGAMTGIAVDARGVVYTGVSGTQDSGRVFAVGAGGALLWDFPVGGLLEWGHPVLGPEGNLYFGEARRCPFNFLPLESGACDAFDVDPRLYAIYRGEGCTPSETTMCLTGGRFAVEVSWERVQGTTGPGRVVPVGAHDSGIFWFFRQENWEMLVKVLDGCEANDHFWVFFAATTDVKFTLTVTDTLTGAQQIYRNPQRHPANAVTDTRAFPTCGVG